jgi:hypothetical protein
MGRGTQSTSQAQKMSGVISRRRGAGAALANPAYAVIRSLGPPSAATFDEAWQAMRSLATAGTPVSQRIAAVWERRALELLAAEPAAEQRMQRIRLKGAVQEWAVRRAQTAARATAHALQQQHGPPNVPVIGYSRTSGVTHLLDPDRKMTLCRKATTFSTSSSWVFEARLDGRELTCRRCAQAVEPARLRTIYAQDVLAQISASELFSGSQLSHALAEKPVSLDAACEDLSRRLVRAVDAAWESYLTGPVR